MTTNVNIATTTATAAEVIMAHYPWGQGLEDAIRGTLSQMPVRANGADVRFLLVTIGETGRTQVPADGGDYASKLSAVAALLASVVMPMLSSLGIDSTVEFSKSFGLMGQALMETVAVGWGGAELSSLSELEAGVSYQFPQEICGVTAEEILEKFYELLQEDARALEELAAICEYSTRARAAR